MSASNNFTLSGNATRDPESREVNDTTVANIGVAWTDRRSKNKDTSFFDCEAWGPLADVILKYIRKGDKVLFNGQMIQNRWKDKEGNNRSKHVFRVQEIDLIPNGRKGEVPNTGASSEEGGEDAPINEEDIPF